MSRNHGTALQHAGLEATPRPAPEMSGRLLPPPRQRIRASLAARLQLTVTFVPLRVSN